MKRPAERGWSEGPPIPIEAPCAIVTSAAIHAQTGGHVQEPETHYTRGKEGHVGYQVVGGGPFDLVFIPSWLTCVDGMWEEPTLTRLLRRLGDVQPAALFRQTGARASPIRCHWPALPTLDQWNDDVRAVPPYAQSFLTSKQAGRYGPAAGWK